MHKKTKYNLHIIDFKLANLNSAHNTSNFIFAVVIDYSIIHYSNCILLYTRKIGRLGF